MKCEGYENIQGVDISSEALDICRKHVTESVFQADVMTFLKDCVAKKEKFSCVYALDTIEHFSKQDVAEIFKMVYQLLDVNGFFVVKVGNMAAITGHELAAKDFTHHTFFTEKTLEYLSRLSGFKMARVYGVKPILLKSKILYFFDRVMHQLVYRLSRSEVPNVTDRKLIAVLSV